MNTKNKTSSKYSKQNQTIKKKRKGGEEFSTKVNKMRNIVKNGLYLDLNFRGSLHLSLKDKKINGYDKLVINVNKTERGTWVDMIVIYNLLDRTWESFRIGGEVLESLTGHQDLHKWFDLSISELEWEGVVSDENKDKLLLEIFNFVNNVSEVIITSDTEFELKDQDGLGVETFYPWPDDLEEECDDEIVEEVVVEEDEDTVKEIVEEKINFKGYDYKCVHERGNNKRSDEYVDKRIGSVIYAVVETDEDGEDHFIGGDILKSSKSIYGGPTRVVSIYNLADVERCRNNLEDVLDRVIKASDLTIEAERILAKDILEHDAVLLLDKIEEGLKWKEASLSPSDSE